MSLCVSVCLSEFACVRDVDGDCCDVLLALTAVFVNFYLRVQETIRRGEGPEVELVPEPKKKDAEKEEEEQPKVVEIDDDDNQK